MDKSKMEFFPLRKGSILFDDYNNHGWIEKVLSLPGAFTTATLYDDKYVPNYKRVNSKTIVGIIHKLNGCVPVQFGNLFTQLVQMESGEYFFPTHLQDLDTRWIIVNKEGKFLKGFVERSSKWIERKQQNPVIKITELCQIIFKYPYTTTHYDENGEVAKYLRIIEERSGIFDYSDLIPQHDKLILLSKLNEENIRGVDIVNENEDESVVVFCAMKINETYWDVKVNDIK